VTEFTKSQSLAASTVTTSPGDFNISTDSVKSRTPGHLCTPVRSMLYAGYEEYMEQRFLDL
jgi:hypothetical protein